MAIVKIKPIKATLKKAIDYISNEEKTDEGILISSFGCATKTADIEFDFTRQKGTQRGDILAYHLVQSFAPGEIDVKEAHRLGMELANQVLKGQYEFVLTTHIDKGHIHNHIMFNSTNFITRKKYQDNKYTYKTIQRKNDEICKENGYSTIDKKSGTRGKQYYEYQQNKNGNSWKSKLKNTIDECILKASDWEEFLLLMQMKGYEIKEGEHIAFRAVDQERFTRAKTIGEFYTESMIKARINNKKKYEQKSYQQEEKTTKSRKNFTQYSKVNLIVDLADCIKAQENGGYKYAMEMNNLNQMARTMNYLVENKITTIDNIIIQIGNEKKDVNQAARELKSIEKQMMNLSEQIKFGQNYWKYKKIGDQAKKEKIGSAFYQKYQKELLIYETAKRYMTANGIDEKELKIKEMIASYKNLQGKKPDIEKRYKSHKSKLKELNTIRDNIEKMLHIKVGSEQKNYNHKEKDDTQR